jgi:endonuclease/exonuclease/phosphatase family metal-dependent hydrolase
MTGPLRVVSFNVKRLSGKHLERARKIGELLATLDPDVCCLQEIEDEQESAVAGTARAAGFAHYSFVPHATKVRRGVALLHREQSQQTTGARLEARVFDDKGFVCATLSRGPQPFDVIGLHLDPFSRARRLRQVLELSRALGPPTRPRVVMGDLNAMSPMALARGHRHDDTVDALAIALHVQPLTGGLRSFPAARPVFELDWVLASPELELADARVVPTRLSDHAALVAELRWRN